MANISSPFGQNEWLVEEMYRKFRDDPSSVDESWHEFLVDYNPESSGEASQDGPATKAKPAESKPVAAKPAETKPAAAKPAEAKPAEAKPAEPTRPY